LWDDSRKKNASCLHDNGCQFNVDAEYPLALFFSFIFLNEIFFRVYHMMSEPPKPKEGDEICNTEKSKHMPEEMQHVPERYKNLKDINEKSQ